MGQVIERFCRQWDYRGLLLLVVVCVDLVIEIIDISKYDDIKENIQNIIDFNKKRSKRKKYKGEENIVTRCVNYLDVYYIFKN